MNKRGLSDVVTTVLIILLALAAILLIWIFISNFLKDTGEEIKIRRFTSTFDIPLSSISKNNDELSFAVKRTSGTDVIKGIIIGLEDSTKKVVPIRKDDSYETPQSRSYVFNYTEKDLVDVVYISVAPIYGDGKVGDILVRVKIGEILLRNNQSILLEVEQLNLTNSTYGNGNDGSPVIDKLNTVINNYTFLIGNEMAGDDEIEVDSTLGFSPGDEIMILQVQNYSGGIPGEYEFAWVTAIEGNKIKMLKGLSSSYYSGEFNKVGATVTQVIRVPNYINLTITSTGSITAPGWNGYYGGVVILRANDTVRVEGSIDVSGKGFRGVSHMGNLYRNENGYQGESTLGLGIKDRQNNFHSGGGGYGYNVDGYDAASGGGGGTFYNSGSYSPSSSSYPLFGLPQNGNDYSGSPQPKYGKAGLSVPIDYFVHPAYLGGAGGEGGADEDGVYPGAGGNGGGIIEIISYRLETPFNGHLNASGMNGGSGCNNCTGGSGYGMGGGGGGAGGAIVLFLNEGGDLTLFAERGLGGSGTYSLSRGGNGGLGIRAVMFIGVLELENSNVEDIYRYYRPQWII